MTEDLFFKLYIPALIEAIKNDSHNVGYHVQLPIDYIDDRFRNDVDVFALKNYENYKDLFDLESLYFDAKSHYLREVNGVDISIYRDKLLDYALKYRRD